MKQKAGSQEKQNANKTEKYRSQDRSGDGLLSSERSISDRPCVPARFQPMPLEPCLDCAATYDPNINYAIVLASLLLLLATRDAEQLRTQARPRS